MAARRRLIAVCGESDPLTTLGDVAFEIGRGIAERGAVLFQTADTPTACLDLLFSRLA